MRRTAILTILIFVLATQFSWSQIPQTMSYQGVLADAGGTPVANGNYDLTFSIYGVATAGVALWTETQSVAVVDGAFSVILGSVNPLTPDFDQQYWLGVTVGAGDELAPRIQLTSTPYSLNAQSVADGAVTGDAIANGHVVRSINGKTDNVTVAEGTNVTITPTGNTLTISAAFDGWSLTGNAGTTVGTHFLGTTDDVPLELRVNGSRVLRFEHAVDSSGYRSANIIAGYSGNTVGVDVAGAVIAGGGSAGDGYPNSVTDDYGTVGGGVRNTASGEHATVGGGYGNKASGNSTTVGGGFGNKASNWDATVGGGRHNAANEVCATVGGGKDNTASEDFAVVGGGDSNTASAKHATISGGGRSNPSDPATGNRVTDDYGTISGGGNNQAGDAAGSAGDAVYATVGGGYSNTAGDNYTTISGGAANTASGDFATVCGGLSNTANARYATISGGGRSNPSDPATGNRVTDDYGTISGGGNNQAGNADGATENAIYTTVGGGQNNEASADYATVPGGYNNTAQGAYSFAAGRRARIAADHGGTFLFSDSNDLDLDSAAADEFAARCTGGVRFVTAIDGSGNPTAGVQVASGGGAWSTISNRDRKENFSPMDGREVLKRLASIPVESWNYKSQDASIRHMGPMAQDFYAAFGLGEGNKYITTVDADGVALAAIQGLYELVKEKDAQIAELGAEKAALQASVDGLKARMKALEAMYDTLVSAP